LHKGKCKTHCGNFVLFSPSLSPRSQGLKLTFFGRHQLEKCGRQKVSLKFFLRSETKTKIFGRHRLAGKIFAFDVIRTQTSAEIIF